MKRQAGVERLLFDWSIIQHIDRMSEKLRDLFERIRQSKVNFPLFSWLTSRGPLVFVAACAGLFVATGVMTSFRQLFESALGFTSPYAAGLCGADLIVACIAAAVGWMFIPAFVGAVAGIIATTQLSDMYNQPKPKE
ncbi:hypothetical protein ACWCQL_01530 [Streptomyces sp. NPDC002073]